MISQGFAGFGEIRNEYFSDAVDDIGFGLLVVEGEETDEESGGRANFEDALRFVEFLLDKVVELSVIFAYSVPSA